MALFWSAQFLDADGNVVDGVKVQHFSAGTTTKKDVFIDQGATTVDTQPSIGDSRGRVWFYGNGTYHLKVEDKNGILLYDFDNVEIDDTLITFSNTSLKVKDTDASHHLIFKPGSDLTANRTMTFTTGDADADVAMLGLAQTWSAIQNFGVTTYINESANTKMALGFTINQGANDDEILALKSSDVGHGFTTDVEADTFATFQKAFDTGGGLAILGWTDPDNENFGALSLIGNQGEAADTDTAITGHGVVRIIGRILSGSTVGAVADGGNILSVDNSGTTRFIIQGDGDFFVTNRSAGAGDVVAGLISDEWDDVALCRALDYDKARLGAGGLILDEWDKFVTYKRKELIEAGIFDTDNPDALMNMSQLSRLHNGAIWQLGKKMMAMEQKFLALEAR